MRKIGRRVLAVLGLVVCLGVPQQALAISYEDSLDDCSYPPVLDVMVMRPLGLAATVLGLALFVPISPFAVFTVWDEVDRVANDLFLSPAAFTFRRPLGECAGVLVAY